MYNEGRDSRRLYVASFSDDVPNLSRGDLIPKRTLYTAPKEAIRNRDVWYARPVLLMTFSVLLFAVSIGATGYSVFRGQTSVAAPIVVLQSNLNYDPEPLQYGIALELGDDDGFDDTRESFIADQLTFVEVNLATMRISYYESGEEVESYNVLSKGEKGSWWQVPSGIYEVDVKKEKRYSTFSNVYLPWSISFEGNFSINGLPYYPDYESVPVAYAGGGIRLSNEDAESLFNHVAIGVPVLVHEKNFANDDFLYEAKVPDMHANQYLVADLLSSTVLAANGMEETAPIASLTKLMTALVAAENIDLEKNIAISTGAAPLVSSLIPRLENNYSASMYSLLQLLLMESSNEAAEIIVSEIGRAEFIELMNKKAVALGMHETTFTDPSGLDDGNESSARDLLRLVQYIHHNRGFILELTSNQHLPTAYTNGQFGELANFNKIEGVEFIAGKVGETNAAGQTSVSLHTVEISGQERIIEIILLGTDERTNDIKRLFTYVEEQFN